MRILLLGPTPQLGRGGIETQLEQLIPALQQRGHRCEAVDTFHQPWSASLVRLLMRSLSRCDVVCMMGLHLKAYPLCLVMGRPVLVSHHIAPGGARWRQLLHRWIIQRLPSTYNSAFLASCSHRGRSKPVVVHPCYAASSFPPLGALSPPWEQRPVAVGFVGRLIPEKGAALVLQACAALNRAELSLQVIGAGPCLPQLEAMASAHHLGVRFSGPLDAAGVAQALQQLKVLVIPSLCPETFGVVMLEGLAAGCHVVAAAIGGLPEAGAEFATFVPPGDVAALTAALAALLDGPPPQQLQARERHLQRFTPPVVAQMLEAQLQQVLRR